MKNEILRMRRFGAALAVVVLPCFSITAHCGVMAWTNAAGGSFHDSANWRPNAVPSAGDTAVFDLAGAPYTVAWSSDVTNHTHIVKAGDVTFDLRGHTYSLSQGSSNYVGTADTTAVATFTNGLVRRLDPVYTGSTTRERFHLRGPGSALLLRNARHRDVAYYFSMDAGTRIVVDGPGADFRSFGYSIRTDGLVIVTNGAFMSGTASLTIGSPCRIHVDGPGLRAQFSIRNTGMAAGASLVMSRGASVNHGYFSADNTATPIAGSVTLGDGAVWYDHYTALSRGWRSFDGPAALLQGSGSVEMQRIIMNGGTIRPGGALGAGLLSFTGLITNASPESVLEIEIGGVGGGEYDRIGLAGGLRGPGVFFAGGRLRVTPLDGFEPREPVTFQLIDAVEIVPAFDEISLPAWRGSWIVDHLYSTGTITFVPDATGSTLLMW